jgi:hypothetical protein
MSRKTAVASGQRRCLKCRQRWALAGQWGYCGPCARGDDPSIHAQALRRANERKRAAAEEARLAQLRREAEAIPREIRVINGVEYEVIEP